MKVRMDGTSCASLFAKTQSLLPGWRSLNRFRPEAEVPQPMGKRFGPG